MRLEVEARKTVRAAVSSWKSATSLWGCTNKDSQTKTKKKKKEEKEMVKVLLLKHLFDAQQVIGLDEEPILITSSEEVFLVATKNGEFFKISIFFDFLF
jgi:hypothetical protein